MEILVILIGFFVFVTISFLAIAVFFPEWVGITGKKAHEITREQKGDPSTSTQTPKVADEKK